MLPLCIHKNLVIDLVAFERIRQTRFPSYAYYGQYPRIGSYGKPIITVIRVPLGGQGKLA